MTHPLLSRRLKNIPASPMRRLIPYAIAAKKKGVHIYHLNIGDPDIQTPSVMIKALKTWAINPISYAQSHGEPVFLDALTKYYKRIGFPFIIQDNIQVMTGGSDAILTALFTIANPGDEVIVFEPSYSNYNTYSIVNNINLVNYDIN